MKVRKCSTSHKIRYYDRVDALLALSRIQHTDSTKRPKMEKHAYWCTYCTGWHLTSR